MWKKCNLTIVDEHALKIFQTNFPLTISFTVFILVPARRCCFLPFDFRFILWLLKNFISNSSMLVTIILVWSFFMNIWGSINFWCGWCISISKLTHENSTPDVARWSLPAQTYSKIDCRKIHYAPILLKVRHERGWRLPASFLVFEAWEAQVGWPNEWRRPSVVSYP